MKKLFVVFSLVAVMFLTGCEKGSNSEVVCTMKEESVGVTMDISFKLKFVSNNLDSAKFEMDAKLDDSIKAYASTFVSSLESQFDNYESDYGVKVNTKETSDGAKIDFTMNQDTFKKLYGSSNFKSSKEDVIKSLEADGYTCK